MKKLKFKKGDFVQVYVPCVAQIKRVNKEIGYTLTVLPSGKSEMLYYQDKDLVKISQKSEFYRETIREFLKTNKILTSPLTAHLKEGR